MRKINTVTSKSEMGEITLQAISSNNPIINEIKIGDRLLPAIEQTIILSFKEIYNLFILNQTSLPYGGFRRVDEDSKVRVHQVNTIIWPEEYGYHRGTYLNRQSGIAVNVKDIIALGSNQFKLIFSDSESHGIFDGNHSWSAILESCQYWYENKIQVPDEKVKIEVYIDLDPVILPEIVESRSSSVALKPMSLSEGRGDFNWIKDVIDNVNYYNSSANKVKLKSDQIAFEENSDLQPDVLRILKYLTALNVALYGAVSYNEAWEPVQGGKKTRKLMTVPAFEAYNYTGSIIDKLYIPYKNLYENQSGVLVDIINLHDYIKVNAPIWSPDVMTPSTQRDHASIYETSRLYQENVDRLIFYKPKNEKPILADGYVYMILSALRPFFKLENNSIDGKMIWQDDWNLNKLIALLDEDLGAKIVNKLRSLIQVVKKQQKNRRTGELSTEEDWVSETRSTTVHKPNWDSLAGEVISALKTIRIKQYSSLANNSPTLVTSSPKPAVKVVRTLTAN
jgi:hypothetical protein